MLTSVYAYTVGAQITRVGLYAFMGWRWHTWGIIIAAVAATALSVILNILIWEIESRRAIQHAPPTT
jgi:hypothetical protein